MIPNPFAALVRTVIGLTAERLGRRVENTTLAMPLHRSRKSQPWVVRYFA
jgi:hypothetical protein